MEWGSQFLYLYMLYAFGSQLAPAANKPLSFLLQVTDSCVEKGVMLYQSSNPSPVQVAPSAEEQTVALSKLQALNEDNLR